MKRRVRDSSSELRSDFVAAFISCLDSMAGQPIAAITSAAIASQAPSWYIPYRHAADIISFYCRFGRLPRARSARSAAKAQALVERYKVMAVSNSGLSRPALVRMILDSPAPRFFISERTARDILARRKFSVKNQ